MSLSSPNRGGNVDDFYSWSTPYSRKSGMAVSPSKLSPNSIDLSNNSGFIDIFDLIGEIIGADGILTSAESEITSELLLRSSMNDHVLPSQSLLNFVVYVEFLDDIIDPNNAFETLGASYAAKDGVSGMQVRQEYDGVVSCLRSIGFDFPKDGDEALLLAALRASTCTNKQNMEMNKKKTVSKTSKQLERFFSNQYTDEQLRLIQDQVEVIIRSSLLKKLEYSKSVFCTRINYVITAIQLGLSNSSNSSGNDMFDNINSKSDPKGSKHNSQTEINNSHSIYFLHSIPLSTVSNQSKPHSTFNQAVSATHQQNRPSLGNNFPSSKSHLKNSPPVFNKSLNNNDNINNDSNSKNLLSSLAFRGNVDASLGRVFAETANHLCLVLHRVASASLQIFDPPYETAQVSDFFSKPISSRREAIMHSITPANRELLLAGQFSLAGPGFATNRADAHSNPPHLKSRSELKTTGGTGTCVCSAIWAAVASLCDGEETANLSWFAADAASGSLGFQSNPWMSTCSCLESKTSISIISLLANHAMAVETGQIPDKPIKLLKKPDGGVSSSTNFEASETQLLSCTPLEVLSRLCIESCRVALVKENNGGVSARETADALGGSQSGPGLSIWGTAVEAGTNEGSSETLAAHSAVLLAAKRFEALHAYLLCCGGLLATSLVSQLKSDPSSICQRLAAPLLAMRVGFALLVSTPPVEDTANCPSVGANLRLSGALVGVLGILLRDACEDITVAAELLGWLVSCGSEVEDVTSALATTTFCSGGENDANLNSLSLSRLAAACSHLEAVSSNSQQQNQTINSNANKGSDSDSKASQHIEATAGLSEVTLAAKALGTLTSIKSNQSINKIMHGAAIPSEQSLLSISSVHNTFNQHPPDSIWPTQPSPSSSLPLGRLAVWIPVLLRLSGTAAGPYVSQPVVLRARRDATRLICMLSRVLETWVAPLSKLLITREAPAGAGEEDEEETKLKALLADHLTAVEWFSCSGFRHAETVALTGQRGVEAFANIRDATQVLEASRLRFPPFAFQRMSPSINLPLSMMQIGEYLPGSSQLDDPATISRGYLRVICVASLSLIEWLGVIVDPRHDSMEGIAWQLERDSRELVQRRLERTMSSIFDDSGTYKLGNGNDSDSWDFDNFEDEFGDGFSNLTMGEMANVRQTITSACALSWRVSTWLRDVRGKEISSRHVEGLLGALGDLDASVTLADKLLKFRDMRRDASAAAYRKQQKYEFAAAHQGSKDPLLANKFRSPVNSPSRVLSSVVSLGEGVHAGLFAADDGDDPEDFFVGVSPHALPPEKFAVGTASCTGPDSSVTSHLDIVLSELVCIAMESKERAAEAAVWHSACLINLTASLDDDGQAWIIEGGDLTATIASIFDAEARHVESIDRPLLDKFETAVRLKEETAEALGLDTETSDFTSAVSRILDDKQQFANASQSGSEVLAALMPPWQRAALRLASCPAAAQLLLAQSRKAETAYKMSVGILSGLANAANEDDMHEFATSQDLPAGNTNYPTPNARLPRSSTFAQSPGLPLSPPTTSSCDSSSLSSSSDEDVHSREPVSIMQSASAAKTPHNIFKLHLSGIHNNSSAIIQPSSHVASGQQRRLPHPVPVLSFRVQQPSSMDLGSAKVSPLPLLPVVSSRDASPLPGVRTPHYHALSSRLPPPHPSANTTTKTPTSSVRNVLISTPAGTGIHRELPKLTVSPLVDSDPHLPRKRPPVSRLEEAWLETSSRTLPNPPLYSISVTDSRRQLQEDYLPTTQRRGSTVFSPSSNSIREDTGILPAAQPAGKSVFAVFNEPASRLIGTRELSIMQPSPVSPPVTTTVPVESKDLEDRLAAFRAKMAASKKLPEPSVPLRTLSPSVSFSSSSSMSLPSSPPRANIRPPSFVPALSLAGCPAALYEGVPAAAAALIANVREGKMTEAQAMAAADTELMRQVNVLQEDPSHYLPHSHFESSSVSSSLASTPRITLPPQPSAIAVESKGFTDKLAAFKAKMAIKPVVVAPPVSSQPVNRLVSSSSSFDSSSSSMSLPSSPPRANIRPPSFVPALSLAGCPAALYEGVPAAAAALIANVREGKMTEAQAMAAADMFAAEEAASPRPQRRPSNIASFSANHVRDTGHPGTSDWNEGEEDVDEDTNSLGGFSSKRSWDVMQSGRRWHSSQKFAHGAAVGIHAATDANHRAIIKPVLIAARGVTGDDGSIPAEWKPSQHQVRIMQNLRDADSSNHLVRNSQTRLLHDKRVHVALLTLLIHLFRTACGDGALNSRVSSAQTSERSPWIILIQHLRNPENLDALAGAMAACSVSHAPRSHLYLLAKMLCPLLLPRSLWSSTAISSLGAGAFGRVDKYEWAVHEPYFEHKPSVAANSISNFLAVKRVHQDLRDHSRSSGQAMVREVWAGLCARMTEATLICEPLLAGLDDPDGLLANSSSSLRSNTSPTLVMPLCSSSLSSWRRSLSPEETPLDTTYLPFVLTIFQHIVDATAELHASGVVHLDIKADNVLLDASKSLRIPVPSTAFPTYHQTRLEHLLDVRHCAKRGMSLASPPPLPTAPPLCGIDLPSAAERSKLAAGKYDPDSWLILMLPRVRLADLGEARVLRPGESFFGNAGTECVKPPQMLLVERTIDKQRAEFDRRKAAVAGVTATADTWSLGCLLYELLTGNFLFGAFDFPRFLYTLAPPSGTEIPVLDSEQVRATGFLQQKGSNMDPLNAAAGQRQSYGKGSSSQQQNHHTTTTISYDSSFPIAMFIEQVLERDSQKRLSARALSQKVRKELFPLLASPVSLDVNSEFFKAINDEWAQKAVKLVSQMLQKQRQELQAEDKSILQLQQQSANVFSNLPPHAELRFNGLLDGRTSADAVNLFCEAVARQLKAQKSDEIRIKQSQKYFADSLRCLWVGCIFFWFADSMQSSCSGGLLADLKSASGGLQSAPLHSLQLPSVIIDIRPEHSPHLRHLPPHCKLIRVSLDEKLVDWGTDTIRMATWVGRHGAGAKHALGAYLECWKRIFDGPVNAAVDLLRQLNSTGGAECDGRFMIVDLKGRGGGLAATVALAILMLLRGGGLREALGCLSMFGCLPNVPAEALAALEMMNLELVMEEESYKINSNDIVNT